MREDNTNAEKLKLIKPSAPHSHKKIEILDPYHNRNKIAEVALIILY